MIASIMLMLASTVYADIKIGETLIVKEGKTVEDAVSISGDVRVYGTVTGSAVALGGNVEVESGGKINGDAVALGGDISVKNNGEISQKAVSIGGKTRVDYGGVVRGETVETAHFNIPFFKHDSHSIMTYNGRHRAFRDSLSGISKLLFLGPFAGALSALVIFIITALFIIKILVKCGIAALASYLLPQHVQNMADCARLRFWQSLLVGLLTIVLIPFSVLLLIVSILGIPLVPLLIVTIIIAYLFGSVGTALWIGNLLPNAAGRSVMYNALLGVLVIGLAGFFPIIGFFIGIVFSILSLGVVIVTRFGVNSLTAS
jgi:hypothetical protein